MNSMNSIQRKSKSRVLVLFCLVLSTVFLASAWVMGAEKKGRLTIDTVLSSDEKDILDSGLGIVLCAKNQVGINSKILTVKNYESEMHRTPYLMSVSMPSLSHQGSKTSICVTVSR